MAKKTLNNNPNYVLFIAILFILGGGTCFYFEFAPSPEKDPAAVEATEDGYDVEEVEEAPAQIPGSRPGEGGAPRLLLWGGVICIVLGCAGIARSFLLRRGKDFVSDPKR